MDTKKWPSSPPRARWTGLTPVHPGLDGGCTGLRNPDFLHLLRPPARPQGSVCPESEPLGNPGMPMKMPFGPKWFKSINWNMPNAIQSLIPGYENVATALMKQTIANNGVATIPDLRELCQEAEVKFIACQMTVELFGFEHSDFIDGLEYGGAATFFEFAGETDICLFI